MEKRAEETISLNNSILKQLDVIRQQGVIVLKANVIFEEGHPLVYIEESNTNVSPKFDDTRYHSPFTRYGSIPQYERFMTSNEQCYLIATPNGEAISDVKASFNFLDGVELTEIEGVSLDQSFVDAVPVQSMKYLLIHLKGN